MSVVTIKSQNKGRPSVMEVASGSHSLFDASMILTVDSSSTMSKIQLGFMDKRQIYKVIEDGVDCTPDDIVDPDQVTMQDTFAHAAFETKSKFKSELALKEAKSRSFADTGMKVYATTISLDDIEIDHTMNTEEGYVATEVDVEQAPSAFYLPRGKPIMSYPPEIFVSLKETETCFLFDLPSFSYDKGTTDGNLVEEENEYYQYITVGKGRNRKMVIEETQTNQTMTQTRHTLATRPQKKNAISFASVWDMYDTYAQLAKIKPEEEPDEMVLYQTAASNLLRKKKRKVEDRRGKSFLEIGNSPRFLDAVLVVERVLAALKFTDAQKVFRGLTPVDPLSLDLVYIYTMKPLWTLECDETSNRPITSISFNTANGNILAVSHGKFSYAESHTGLISIWCTKNPCIPERLYRFDDPVTSVAFSEKNPNHLSCGFENGDVLIIDVTSHPVNIIAKNKRETNPCFEPIWVTKWRSSDSDSEYVMAACQDGRINKFTSTKTHDFICTPMMRLCTVEGKMKGIETPKTCLKVDVPITRYPAALCLELHPSIPHAYLVGTDEGCIHKCSTHYLNQHMDVFRAHAGPVYSIALSPFMKSLMVTCGADGAVRLWMDGIDDVIITLTCPAAVYDIAFCPINSTLLLSASGNVLSIWDLRRKTHIPCAEYTFSSHTVLTYVRFSPSGDNVFVGDTMGKIHTFHLVDTPIPPYYQKKLINETIRNALCTRPQLLKQLDKLESLRAAEE